ncbi:MAG: Mu-like prophage major head subunit gpT family protein [Phycisphaerales bacterium]|nr:Mu-like prophage major head subunit gpT family protein [Phycisphaerales bacterium]
MAVISTGLLTKGVRSDFFNRMEATPNHFRDLSTRIVSTTDQENYRWLGTVPKIREWGTGRLAQGLRSESYSVENLKYEATIEVDRDEISDDQTGQIRLRVGELAQRAATHKDFLISHLLIDGETSGNNSYDGVSFFNAAHESGASGQQSNLLTFDAVDSDAPTAEEFKAALAEAIAQMLAFKDDQGEPALFSASGMVCVVPPTMLFTASEAINATVVGNDTNILKGIARVISFPWLTDKSKWYLLKTDGVVRPFIFQDREPIELNALTEDSDEGFLREKFLFGVRARYRMAYGYWQFAVRTDFN